MTKGSLIIVVFCLTTICQGSEYAAMVVSSAGPFGADPYNDPTAVLGSPTSWIYDDDFYFDNIACSLVYGAWNLTPQGGKTVLTLGPGSSIVVGFDHKVLDDPDNPYGLDFIVFGNAAFLSQGTVTSESDMDTLLISNPASMVGAEKVKVEVSWQSSGPWFAYTRGPWGDNLFPTNYFAWNSTNKIWSDPLNSLKPINPNLKSSDFSGLSVSQAIALYDGSAGGTGFDLEWLGPQNYHQLPVDTQTGKRWIQYVRLSYDGIVMLSPEVDALSDVAPDASMPFFPPGDINYDYRVDLTDLMLLAQNWMVCTWMCE